MVIDAGDYYIVEGWPLSQASSHRLTLGQAVDVEQ